MVLIERKLIAIWFGNFDGMKRRGGFGCWRVTVTMQVQFDFFVNIGGKKIHVGVVFLLTIF